MKILKIAISGVLFGILIGILIIIFIPKYLLKPINIQILNPLQTKRQVIGFLPYWLLNSASLDYSSSVTQLAYFGLRIDSDGTLQKFVNDNTQLEPGWNAFISGKVEQYLDNAKSKSLSTSLVIINGDNNSIEKLISDPINNAFRFVNDINPILEKYKFKDLNLDIEYTKLATDGARNNFIKLISTIKNRLDKSITLTVEISGSDVIHPGLIDLSKIGKIANYVVLMGYDFHSPSSFVTGPVSPNNGAGIESEYDVSSAVSISLNKIPNNKFILGIPLYGYEWESLTNNPRSAIIPGSGVVASNKRIQQFLKSCNNCTIKTDVLAQEKYITYPDSNKNTYHIIYFPDKYSTSAKIDLSRKFNLGGIALWALGYEGSDILTPLEKYKN